MSSLEKAAKIALKICMGLKKKESLLIVYDKNKEKIAKTFLNKVKG